MSSSLSPRTFNEHIGHDSWNILELSRSGPNQQSEKRCFKNPPVAIIHYTPIRTHIQSPKNESGSIRGV